MLAGALHLEVVIPGGEGMVLAMEANLEAAIIAHGAGGALLEDDLTGFFRFGMVHGV